MGETARAATDMKASGQSVKPVDEDKVQCGERIYVRQHGGSHGKSRAGTSKQ